MFERFDRPVRCSAGHVYTTIWVPPGSLNGHTATEQELAEAARVHDVRVP